MADAQFIDADDVEFERFEVNTLPPTSARTATEELIAALNDASTSATVSIHRQLGSGKENLTFLESFAPDKYDSDSLLMHIRNTYGGGDYRVHVRENGKIRANRGVSIETPKSVSRETSASGDVRELMMFMQQQQQQMLQIMRESQNKNSNDDGEEKFLSKMLQYKQLFGGEQKSGGISELLGAVDALKLLGVNVGGISPEPQEDGFSKIIESAAPVLTALLNRPQAPQPQPQPRPQPQYKPNPAPRESDDMNLKVKLGVATLVCAAAKNADTAFYADFVYDQVPVDTLRGIFTVPDIEGELAKINPETLKYKEWFSDLSEHLTGMLGMPESKYFNEYNESELQDDVTDDITHENDTE